VVKWSTSTGSVSVTTDSHGAIAPYHWFILTPDVLGPRTAQAVGSPSATANFLVVPNTSEPGGSSNQFLFRSEGP